MKVSKSTSFVAKVWLFAFAILATQIQPGALPPTAAAGKIIFNQNYNLAAGEKANFSINVVKGQKLRLVGSGADANSSSSYLDFARPDGSVGNSYSNIKPSGAGTGAITFGPVSQGGTYKFTIRPSSNTGTLGNFNLKAILVSDPVLIEPGQMIEMDFAEKGEMNSFYINASAGTDYRLVTLSTQDNGSMYSDYARPDGTTNSLYSFRSSGAGYMAQDLNPAQTGRYTFDTYYSQASETGKVQLTLLKIAPATPLLVGKELNLDFSRFGDRQKIKINLTKGYVYNVYSTNQDASSSTLNADYTRPDGTTGTVFSLREGGAGAKATKIGPMLMSGTYSFSIYRNTARDNSDVKITFVRLEKPVIVKPNSPIEINFNIPGQGFSYAVPVNQGDKIQFQTESLNVNLGLIGDFVRPDGTTAAYYRFRYSEAGKQFDTSNPTGYSQTGFYIFNLWNDQPNQMGKLTLTVLGSTSTATNFESSLGNPSGDESSPPPSSTKAEPKPSASASASKSPSPKPTSPSTPGVSETDIKTLTEQAESSIKKIESGSFTQADIQRAIDSANKAVALAEKALKASNSANSNSKDAQETAEKALENASKVKELAKDLETANKSIGVIRTAVNSISKTVIAMTAESACRDKNAKISIGTSIIADSIDLLFGEIKIAKLGAFVLQSAASLNDFRAIDACKGK
jgi:hypothetical protein